MGTPDFMAPEQISTPDAIDQRIDVYALGSLLYTMLAGRAPFADVPFPLIFTRIQTESPPSLTSFRDDLPAPFVAVVERAMARTPEHRHQTMGELLVELLPFVGPVLPPSLMAPRRTSAPKLGVPIAADRSGLGVGTPAVRSVATEASARSLVARSTPASLGDTLVAAPSPAPPPAPDLVGAGGATPAPIIVTHRSPWLTVAVAISLLATLGTVVTVLVLRDRVAPRAPALTPSPDATLALYLDEAERLVGERRYGAARTVLDKAARIDGGSAELEIRMTRVREAAELGELRAAAQAAKAADDQAGVREAAKKVLDLVPDDPEATALLEQARPAPAAPPVAETGVLSVTSTPASKVYVDDRPVGDTPFEAPIATGAHLVELRRRGYATERRRVEIARGAGEELVVPLRAADVDPRPASVEPSRVARVAPPPGPPRLQPVAVDAGLRSAELAPVALVAPPVATPPVVPLPPAQVAPPVDAAPTPRADEIRAPRLPDTYRVSSIKDRTRVLSIVEQEAVDRGAAAVAKGATSKLGQSLFDSFVPGVVIELRPRDMYYTIVRGARAGRGRDQIGSELRSSKFYRTI